MRFFFITMIIIFFHKYDYVLLRFNVFCSILIVYYISTFNNGIITSKI